MPYDTVAHVSRRGSSVSITRRQIAAITGPHTARLYVDGTTTGAVSPSTVYVRNLVRVPTL